MRMLRVVRASGAPSVARCKTCAGYGWWVRVAAHRAHSPRAKCRSSSAGCAIAAGDLHMPLGCRWSMTSVRFGRGIESEARRPPRYDPRERLAGDSVALRGAGGPDLERATDLARRRRQAARVTWMGSG